ncbi:LytR C-terminal domain-containing protein [Actinomycetospora sp. C-140]
MTGPGSADASRMRIAGIVLLAVAGVAAVIGLLALGGEGPASPTAAPASPTAAPLPGANGATPTPPPPNQAAVPGAGQPGGPALAPVPGGVPGAGAGAPAGGAGGGGPLVGAPIVPGDAGGAAGSGGSGGSGGGSGGGGGGSVQSAAQVRVFNNSTIQGLADRAASEMRGQGWNVVEVGNYPNGVIPESTVYYRPGTGEQGAADAIAGEFGLRSMPRFDGIQNASPGVIVIATNNWGQNRG